jgi:Spy/CpxP family protein refolding chaperone
MNRIRLLVLGAALVLAVPAIAQQVATETSQQPHSQLPGQLPSVDQHLQFLAEKLSLTADQQEKARPILAKMQESVQKVMDDKSLTKDEAREKTHSAMMKADKEMRESLTEEQKKMLDQLEADSEPPTPQR